MVVKGFNYSLNPVYDFVFGNVLGRPCAAPVFMFCMGVGVVYSRHSQWNTMVKRGAILYLTGILVNVFEFIMPGFILGTLLGRWDVFPIPLAIKISQEFPMCIEPEMEVPLAMTCSSTSILHNSSAMFSIQCVI